MGNRIFFDFLHYELPLNGQKLFFQNVDRTPLVIPTLSKH